MDISGLKNIYNISKTGAAAIAVGKVAGVVRVICYLCAVGALMFVGYKYVVASAEGRAEIKKSSLAILGGSVLLLGIGTVAETLVGLAMKLFGNI